MLPFPNSSSHGPEPTAMIICGTTMEMLRTPVHSPAHARTQVQRRVRINHGNSWELGSKDHQQARDSPCPPPLLAASCAVTANGTLHRTCTRMIKHHAPTREGVSCF
jgi:hypothetical protein